MDDRPAQRPHQERPRVRLSVRVLMALVLALNDESYEDVATKFFEHYLAIAGAVQTSGLWDDTDGYFYDVLHLNDGRDVPVRVRSLVGLVPLVAAAEFHYGILDHLPGFAARAEWYVRNHPELAHAIMERKGPADRDVANQLTSNR